LSEAWWLSAEAKEEQCFFKSIKVKDILKFSPTLIPPRLLTLKVKKYESEQMKVSK
jgi:hypothetical protein